MACKATEPVTLDDLPVEMVCEVLRRLSLADLVRFKMTAKRYQQIVTDFRVKQLNVTVHQKSDSIDHSIDHCPPNLFVRQAVQPTLSHLQQLTIDAHLKHFDLNELNRFTRLVQLKIHNKLPEGPKLILNLPDLSQLEVICNRRREMSINSTKLQELTYYGDGSLLQVEHPESVVVLDSDLPGDHLRRFRNVRYLRSSTNLRILEEDTLLNLLHLEEIAYTGTYKDVWEALENYTQRGHPHWESTYDLSPYLERFMAKKRELQRTDLKVKFVSLELVDHKPIKNYRFDEFFYDYDRHSFSELQLHAHNFNEILGTLALPNVDYYDLMDAFDWRLPDDFFSKFVGIKRVDLLVSDVDEEQLLRFLQSVPELEALDLYATTLSESFFRRLSENGSTSLRSMSISLGRSETLRNLDFSVAFRALHSFTLSMRLSLEEIRWLLNMSWSSKSQFHVTFQYRTWRGIWFEYAVVRHLNSDEALLYRGDNRNVSFGEMQILKTCSLACLDELVEYFEK